MKTNFEKWKAGLKPEDLLSKFFIKCGSCPAIAVCEKAEDNESWTCESTFLAWANAPAEGEE